ncbi:ParB N-terminal domain-containing protein [Azotobacter sp. CWF10]
MKRETHHVCNQCLYPYPALAGFPYSPQPQQPAQGRNPERYEHFKQSVMAQGILQAILVRPIQGDPEHDFEIVAGKPVGRRRPTAPST